MATSRRQEKVQSLLRQFAADYIQGISGSDSLISVTKVDISPDLKYADLYISVLPSEKESSALAFLERKMGGLREFIKPKLSMKTLPYFRVKIDKGEKSRARIDELLDGEES